MKQTENMIAIKSRDHEKSKRAALATLLAGGSLVVWTNSHALTPAQVTAATTDNDASELIDTAAIWILGIVVGIYAVRKVIGFFGR